MTTDLSVDLTSNTFKFGSIANGQITDMSADISLRSQQGSMPFSGVISGNFAGEVKGAKTIPLTIPHKANSSESYTIAIVGAGGTGGYLIRDLARFIYALREKGDSRDFRIKIIDADIVEKKYVLRQNFTVRDIGKYKAEVMAKRYSAAFGLEIEAITKMIETKQDLAEIFSRLGYNSTKILVGCVDNNKARRVFSDHIRFSDTYWIDSGNETKSGQIILGYGKFDRDLHRGSAPSRNSNYRMPNVTHLYPEILDPNEDDLEQANISCADRAMVDTQNIFVNMTAAGHQLSFIRQIILQEPITINSIEFNIKGVTEVKHLTKDYILDVRQKALNR